MSTLEAVRAPNSVASVEGTSRIAPSLRFVYCIHTEEYSPDIVDALRDADVVALECIGERAENRQLEKLANQASNGDTSALGQLPEDTNPFLEGILSDLQGSGKKIHLVDIYLEDPIHEYIASAVRRAEEVENDILTLPAALLKRRMENAISLLMGSSQLREKIVARQVGALVRTYPGKNIAVMQGMLHTPTSHQKENWPGMPVARTFIPEEAGKVKANFKDVGPRHALLRAKQFYPERSFDEISLDRMLLNTYLEVIADISLARTDLSDDEVQAAVEDLEVIKQESETTSRKEHFTEYLAKLLGVDEQSEAA